MARSWRFYVSTNSYRHNLTKAKIDRRSVFFAGALFLFALLRVVGRMIQSGSMKSIPLQYRRVWLTDEFGSRRNDNPETASMLITLLALAFLSIVILAIGLMLASTNGREIVVWRERETLIIFEPNATSYGLVRD